MATRMPGHAGNADVVAPGNAGKPPRSRFTSRKALLRYFVAVVVSILVVNLLLPQVSQADSITDALGHAQWRWIAVLFAAAALSHVAAAVGLIGAAGRRMSVVRLTQVQLAASFGGRLAPSGIGAVAVNLRYLTSAGLDRTQALTVLSVNAVAGAFIHVLLLLAVLPFVHSKVYIGFSDIDPPKHWPFLVSVVFVCVFIGAWRWGRHISHHVRPIVISAYKSTMAALSRPRYAALLFGGSVAVTLTHIIGLSASLYALHLHPSFVEVAGVYLIGSAVGVVAPTPGGLGAFEAALIAGFTATGLPTTSVVAAVVVYRAFTFWLSFVVGALAVRQLRSSRLI